MSTILEKPIKVNRIISTNIEQAKALEDPARAKIIEILYKKALTAEQIANELKKSGYKKALTTVRHHIEILKDAGLIEVVRMEENRGAIMKFYGTSTKLLEYTPPEDFESRYSKLIDTTSIKIEKILNNLAPKTVSKGKRQKENSEDYSKYVMMEIVNRAMTNVLEGNSFYEKSRQSNEKL